MRVLNHCFKRCLLLSAIALAFVIFPGQAQAQFEPKIITVNINPAQAVTEGAQWRQFGGADPTWLNTGDTVVYTGKKFVIEFKALENWIKPKRVRLGKKQVGELEVNVEYEPRPVKNITVLIDPDQAVAAGAQWRQFEGTDPTWLNTGDTVVYGGKKFVVEFKDIENWRTPKRIKLGKTVIGDIEVSGEYKPKKKFMNITTFINPAGAIAEGAQWRQFEGADPTWLNSGDTIDYKGQEFIIEFKTITNWLTPDPVTLNRADGNIFVVTGDYVPVILPFDLSVSIFEPDEGRWRIQGGDPTWRLGGELITLEGGTYTIEFIEVPGWITPDPQVIDVTDGTPTLIEVTYTPDVTAFLGVTDVAWDEFTYDGIPAGPISSLNGIPILPSFELSQWSSDPVTSNISFRINSTVANPHVTVEVYSVVEDTTVEDKLLTTLFDGEILPPLDPDVDNPGQFTRFYENFTSWDGRDEAGRILPPGLYKVKVSTAEDDNWDDEVALTPGEYHFIPRQYLRSPFSDPAPEFDPLGSDLETGILAGLYPTYYNGVTEAATPQRTTCNKLFNVEGDVLINYYLNEFNTQLIIPPLPPLPPGGAQAILDELILDGNISPYGVLQSLVVDLETAFDAYETKVAEILALDTPWMVYYENFSWKGHCVAPTYYDPFGEYFLTGYPLLEAPIAHGKLDPGPGNDDFFFENELQGVLCYCGVNESECDGAPTDPISYIAGDYDFCDDCGFYGPGSVCGQVGEVNERWNKTNPILKQDLQGYVHVPIDGTHLQVMADDQATLSLGQDLTVVCDSSLVDCDPTITLDGPFIFSETAVNGAVSTEDVPSPVLPLAPGYYPVEINYVNSSDEGTLQLKWNVQSSNNQNFIFTDPTFIQQNTDDNQAFSDFLNNATDNRQ